ncbi:MAG: hypothetical protein RSD42_02700 [Oscillospiraceae bacterium]
MLAATVAKLSKVSKIKKFDDVLSDLKQTGKFVKNSDIVITNPTNKTIIGSALNSEKILSNTSSINSKIVKNPYDILKQHKIPTTLNDSSIKALDSVKFSAKYDVSKSNKFTNTFKVGIDDVSTVSKSPIIMGENMKRVKQYAAEFGGHAYNPWKNDPLDFDLGMKRNKRWINDMTKDGREIIDIGPDFSRRSLGRDPSPFYNMERSQVKGYDNYKKVFERDGRIFGGVPGLDK